TGFAGGVGAVGEGGSFAVLAPRLLGREIGPFGRGDVERLDKALAEIVGDVDRDSRENRAVRLDQANTAFGHQTAARLVIGDPAGFQRVAAVIDLDVAHRR